MNKKYNYIENSKLPKQIFRNIHTNNNVKVHVDREHSKK
jgi:hypothetical protein